MFLKSKSAAIRKGARKPPTYLPLLLELRTIRKKTVTTLYGAFCEPLHGRIALVLECFTGQRLDHYIAPEGGVSG